MDGNFPGWKLLGSFPDNELNDVGSWLLHNNGESLLLEIPPGLTVEKVKCGLKNINSKLCYVIASHDHEDHFDSNVWNELQKEFPKSRFMYPRMLCKDKALLLGGEPLWIIKAPKHSLTDVVIVFRGVAMTGDIELGQLESVNNEVYDSLKRKSMTHLRTFPNRTGYLVHTVLSAHLNDLRTSINWPELFQFEVDK